MLRRLRNDELVNTYGDPSRFLQGDGSISASWKLAMMDTFKLPAPLPLSWGGTASRVSCHKKVVHTLNAIFQDIFADKEAWNSINDYGGCYEFRRNRNNPKDLSLHSWGLAVDLDTRDNPNKQSVKGKMHPNIVAIFRKYGWLWAPDFGTDDPMHFEQGIE